MPKLPTRNPHPAMQSLGVLITPPPNAYITLVTIVTSAWVYFLADYGFAFLANAMFFPSVAAVGFVQWLNGWTGVSTFLYGAFFGFPTSSVPMVNVHANVPAALVFAVLLPVAATALCGVLALLLGWAKPRAVVAPAPSTAVHSHNAELLQGFLRAAGEEMGWRCWLLPKLIASHGVTSAFLISGVAWGIQLLYPL